MSEKIYHIGGMDCAHCASEVEEGVRKLDGVNGVRVDFFSGKMILSGDVPFVTLQKRVESLGKTIADEVPVADETKPARKGIIGFWDYLQTRRDSQLALLGGVWVLLTFALSIIFALPEALTGVMYTAGMLVTLYPIARSGLNTLIINREFNINLLMTIAAIGAIFIGEYLESATVIFLFAISEALEGYTTDRARDSIRSLMSLKPTHAHRLNGVEETIVPVNQLRIDDVILVKPGENIPMDGAVVGGSSDVNQAPITGESMPVFKTNGDTVFAGTLNGGGALKIRVTHLAADNTLSRIIQLVEDAQSVRAPSQRLIDRFAHYYTPAVVVLALGVAVLPPLLFNAPFYDTADGHGWLYRALSMLVISCPCALVISTPVTVISAITAAARRGVLIKGGAFLEALGSVNAFAFDKTGTLTQGKPVVMQSRSVDCETGASCAACDDVLAMAAAVERRSTHPLAQAVIQAAEARQLLNAYVPAEDVEVLAGRGMQGVIGGKLVTVGSHKLFDLEHPHNKELCEMVSQAEESGYTTMMLCDGDRVRGYIAVADSVREDSRSVIDTINQLGGETVMLTGDNRVVAQAVGQRIGVRDVRAGLLPSDKVDAVRALIEKHRTVAMVGDGVNDTPALAAATVGVAMGGAGSAQALETADIVLMADDLKQLPFAIQLSRFARALIKQNVAISFGIKLFFLVLALFGATSLWAAVLADMGTSLLVTLNGMRPLRFENKKVNQ